MIDAEIIGAVLAKCSAYDARNTPAPSGIVIDAWLEHFGLYPNVTPGDLMAAVKEYYCAHHDTQLQPVDLSSIARKYARDRYERSGMDSPERQAAEAISDAKAAGIAIVTPEEFIRMRAIESYAQRFGISGAEAEARMARSQETRNALDATAVEVAHRRMSGPPAPIECPGCHSTDVPCACEAAAP